MELDKTLSRMDESDFYLDTWLPINLERKCNGGCAYCFLQLFHNDLEQRVSNPNKEVEKLFNHPYFIQGETVLLIDSMSEPFRTKETTNAVITTLRLIAKKLSRRTILSIITKKEIPDEVIKIMANEEMIFPLFFESYSGLDRRFEPKFELDEALASFHKLKELGLPIIHYFRPLIHGHNTDETKVSEVLERTAPFTSAVVYIGLKIPPALYETLKQKFNLQLTRDEEFLVHQGNFEFLRLVDKETVKRVASKHDIVLFRGTSCAISYVYGKKFDYNAGWTVESRCKDSLCKLLRCEDERKKIQVIPADVEKCLKIIKYFGTYSLSESCLKIDSPILESDMFYLKHRLKCRIEVPRIVPTQLWHATTKVRSYG